MTERKRSGEVSGVPSPTSSDDRDDAGDHYHFDDKGYAGI